MTRYWGLTIRPCNHENPYDSAGQKEGGGGMKKLEKPKKRLVLVITADVFIAGGG